MNKLLKLFKSPRPNTAIHPVYKKLIEKIATINGRNLFAFKSLLDMPHNRYNKCTRFATEFNMRLDSEILRNSIDSALNAANEGNFTKVIGILTLLDEHTNMLISVEASYRLASCAYFWEDEDLTDYDFEIGDDKIKEFKKVKLDDFFLSEPMNKFLPQMNLSVTDLVRSSQYEKELKELHLRTLNATKEGLKLGTL